ncbi:MAG: hypothetical protein LC789_02790 [Actinobacteria bacterium]|nr:hypothetical protein [Actinomycetota bacterium]MCA1721201.1 hypothetical protein [Actinomycetota bacterium]
MTFVRGDVDGCGALGATLQRAAAEVGSQARRLAQSPPRGWSGEAAEAFRADAARQAEAADSLAEVLGHIGRALTTFAADLAHAQAMAARAAQCAADAGAAVGPGGLVGGPWAPVPTGPYATPDQAAAAARATRAEAARAEASRLVQAARDAEREAHDRLSRGLRAAAPSEEGGWHLSPPGPPDWVDFVNGLVLAPKAFAERAALKADAAGEFARLLKGATRTGSVAERAAARSEWREALRDYRALRGTERQWAALADEVPLPGVLRALEQPLSESVPVLSKIPVSAVLLSGVSTYLDHEDGMSWGLAATKNVAATGAGMLMYAGAGAALAGAGFIGAPVVIVAVGLGFAMSWGVGQVVEHYGDDISEAASDAADAVGDAADAVGDTASRAWHSVFG